MRILAIGAHPDDIEINCSGTMALYQKQGHEVFMIHVCNGDKGHFKIPPEEMGEIRKKETKNAGKLINAEVISLNYGDAEIEKNNQNVKVFVNAIRSINPDVIITHTSDDYHIDHHIVSKLVVDASFLVTVPHYKTENKPMTKVPQLYFMEPYTGIGFIPLEYVDISEVIDIKINMIREHKSQLEWLKQHDNLSIEDYILTSAKYRGFQCGVGFAEGFIRYNNALRATPGRFLP